MSSSLTLSEELWEEAHTAAREHLEQCHAALMDETEDDPSFAPFCGCTVCEVREVLYAAYPILEKHFAEKENE